MQALLEQLKTSPVVYITRDIERTLGLNPDTEGYFIISNSTPFAKQIAQKRINILLINEEKQLDTVALLSHEYTSHFLSKIKNPSILVFKNTKQIEKICADKKWPLLNPSAELSNKIEEKISQLEILKNLRDLFVEYDILTCKEVKWAGEKFVMQFNHSHTGTGTVMIDSEQKLISIADKFPDREVRIAKYIEGAIFTNNNVVSESNILIGNISYQITGIPPFTDKKFATVGNDWGLTKKLLNNSQFEYYRLIVKNVAEELKRFGWKGLFGVDVIFDKQTGKLSLLEINARQPASTTFESWLQDKQQKKNINTFEAHLASLLGLNLSLEQITEINEGAQIIYRMPESAKPVCPLSDIAIDLRRKNFEVIQYNNTNVGAELLRIQNEKSIMDDHNILNNEGETIASIISSTDKMMSMQAREVIHNYLNIVVDGKKINCPYFNNKRTRARGALRVFTGKGNIEEINEEISIIEKKERLNWSALNESEIRKTLVEHNIGIDCSGFVYHVLDAELRAQNKGKISSNISCPLATGFFRKIIAKFRMAQNTSVMSLAHEYNTFSVKMKEIQPGDTIIMLSGGLKNDRDHILLIEQINYSEGDCLLNKDEPKMPKTIHYVHSFAWSSDGKYNHGVKRGKIEIIDTDAGLMKQKWLENGKTGNENETFLRAEQAKAVDIRRLNALM